VFRKNDFFHAKIAARLANNVEPKAAHVESRSLEMKAKEKILPCQSPIYFLDVLAGFG
jgi:hypothetical protein